jgi:cation diffusion facilitator CzcD-associated flavoprotein CzcO
MTITSSELTTDVEIPVLDALIIGAGVTGVYQLHELRSAGYEVKVLEAGSGVGGTWYWNRYPGARFDSESYSYGYFFSKELLDEWSWSEHFAGQAETERYLNHVVDRFDLRDDIVLNSRVVSAQWDGQGSQWHVTDDRGKTYASRYLLTAVGILSAPQFPTVPGRDTFIGESYHTARWPSRGVNFTDKRVAVIGTGASGVQVIQTVADQVESMTVFQRTPNWCTPLRNAEITPAEQVELKSRYDEIYQITQNQAGFMHAWYPSSAFDHTPEERRRIYEELFQMRGFATLYGNFIEVILDEHINAEFSAFLSEKIAARIDDPVVAAKLIPSDHGYGMKRPPMETNYYEAYNRKNVTLVDLSECSIDSITPRGLAMEDGTEYEFDIIVYATGFDAVTGAFDRISIIGEDGNALKDTWTDGPRTYLGLQTAGFPNLIFIGGPQSVAGNFPRSTERQVKFARELLDHAREIDAKVIRTTNDAQEAWVEEVQTAVEKTLLAVHKKHWSFGGNTPGKAIVHRNYAGGMLTYMRFCDDSAAHGFKGFEFK